GPREVSGSGEAKVTRYLSATDVLSTLSTIHKLLSGLVETLTHSLLSDSTLHSTRCKIHEFCSKNFQSDIDSSQNICNVLFIFLYLSCFNIFECKVRSIRYQ